MRVSFPARLAGFAHGFRSSRLVGRQRLSRVRPWLTVALFPLLTGLLLLGSRGRPELAGALAGGVLFGCALGGYGLRLTKFEQSPLGMFYTPNAHLGIALSLLLVARLAYRAVQFHAVSESVQANGFVRSPLTLFIFGTLAGYYTAYAIGLLRWRRRVVVGGSQSACEQDVSPSSSTR